MAPLSSSCDKSDTVSFIVIVMYLILEAINFYYYCIDASLSF